MAAADAAKAESQLDPIGRAYLKALSSFQSHHGLEVTYEAPPTPPAPRSLPEPASTSKQNGAAETAHTRQHHAARCSTPSITVAFRASPAPAYAPSAGFDPTIGVPGPWMPARAQQATPSPDTGDERHGDHPSSTQADTSTPYDTYGQQQQTGSYGYSYPYHYYQQYDYPYWSLPPPPPPPPPPPLLGPDGHLPGSACTHCGWVSMQHSGQQPLAAAAAAATGNASGPCAPSDALAAAAAALGGGGSLPIPQELQHHAQSVSDAKAAAARALAVGGSEAAAKLLMTWYYAGYHSGAASQQPTAVADDQHMAAAEGQQ